MGIIDNGWTKNYHNHILYSLGGFVRYEDGQDKIGKENDTGGRFGIRLGVTAEPTWRMIIGKIIEGE